MVKYICNKCGSEITGKVYRLIMAEVKKEGPYSMDDLTGEELRTEETRSTHLCESCAHSVIELAQ